MKKVIGITGGIASGKTTVSKYIKSLGYKVYDCDYIAHVVFEEKNIQRKLKEAFDIKSDIVKREDISKLVFSDTTKFKLLDSIMRDAILEKMDAIINLSQQTIFFDTPLLYDWSLEDMFDKIVFVYTKKDIQMKRLMKRDSIDYTYANNKLSAQISIDEKLNIAKSRGDIVIVNDTSELDLYQKVDAFLKELSYDI